MSRVLGVHCKREEVHLKRVLAEVRPDTVQILLPFQTYEDSYSRLAPRITCNVDRFDITESESPLLGRDFGVTTDIQTGPNGNLFLVSLSDGAVYEIFKNP